MLLTYWYSDMLYIVQRTMIIKTQLGNVFSIKTYMEAAYSEFWGRTELNVGQFRIIVWTQKQVGHLEQLKHVEYTPFL